MKSTHLIGFTLSCAVAALLASVAPTPAATPKAAGALLTPIGEIDTEVERQIAIEFSPDGRKLAVGGLTGEFVVVDVQTLKKIDGYPFHPNGHGFAWVPNGDALLFSGGRLMRGERNVHPAVPVAFEALSGVVAVAAGPKNRLAVGTFSTLTMIDLRTEAVIWKKRTHPFAHVSQVHFSPDGEYIATCGSLPPDEEADEYASAWSASDGEELRRVPGEFRTCRVVAGAIIASGVNETISTRITDGKILAKRPWAWSQFAVSNQIAVFGTKEGHLRTCTVPTLGDARLFEAHSRPVTAVALSADGRYAASAGLGGVVMIWRVASGI